MYSTHENEETAHRLPKKKVYIINHLKASCIYRAMHFPRTYTHDYSRERERGPIDAPSVACILAAAGPRGWCSTQTAPCIIKENVLYIVYKCTVLSAHQYIYAREGGPPSLMLILYVCGIILPSLHTSIYEKERETLGKYNNNNSNNVCAWTRTCGYI